MAKHTVLSLVTELRQLEETRENVHRQDLIEQLEMYVPDEADAEELRVKIRGRLTDTKNPQGPKFVEEDFTPRMGDHLVITGPDTHVWSY